MARALIVGCGCRGRELGSALLERGWQVRGTTRSDAGIPAIAAVGIDGVVADPDRIGSVLGALDGVSVVMWALGSAVGPSADAVNGPRLERMLERIVDTPVRGFVYDAAGSLSAEVLDGGAELVREAGVRWQIPVAVVNAERDDWVATCLQATLAIVASSTTRE